MSGELHPGRFDVFCYHRHEGRRFASLREQRFVEAAFQLDDFAFELSDYLPMSDDLDELADLEF